MVTKGIIQSIDYTGNTCSVRIPLFETAAVPTKTIIEATFINTPGIYNGYKEGDVVIIAFENNEIDMPVILGKLYLGVAAEKKEARSAINCSDFTVSNSISIPITAKLTLDDDSLNKAEVDVDGGLSKYKSLADIAKGLQKQTDQIGSINAQLVDTGDGLGARVSQLESNSSRHEAELMLHSKEINARVTSHYNDGEDAKGFGWSLTDSEWKLISNDDSHSWLKNVDILKVDSSGVEISGDLKISGYPKINIVSYLSSNDPENMNITNSGNAVIDGNLYEYAGISNMLDNNSYILYYKFKYNTNEVYSKKRFPTTDDPVYILNTSTNILEQSGVFEEYFDVKAGAQYDSKLWVPDGTETQEEDGESITYYRFKYDGEPPLIASYKYAKYQYPQSGTAMYVKNNTTGLIELSGFDTWDDYSIPGNHKIPEDGEAPTGWTSATPNIGRLGQWWGYFVNNQQQVEIRPEFSTPDYSKNYVWKLACDISYRPFETIEEGEKVVRLKEIVQNITFENVQKLDHVGKIIRPIDKQLDDKTNIALRLIQGKSANYYSDNDPQNSNIIKEGDCWFDTSETFVRVDQAKPEIKNADGTSNTTGYFATKDEYLGYFIDNLTFRDNITSYEILNKQAGIYNINNIEEHSETLPLENWPDSMIITNTIISGNTFLIEVQSTWGAHTVTDTFSRVNNITSENYEFWDLVPVLSESSNDICLTFSAVNNQFLIVTKKIKVDGTNVNTTIPGTTYAYVKNQNTLKQWVGADSNKDPHGHWEDIGGELVANKVTANYINALDITAKRIEVKDSNNDTLFLADGLDTTGNNNKVKIANWTATPTSFEGDIPQDEIKNIEAEATAIIVAENTFNNEHGFKDKIYLGQDGLNYNDTFIVHKDGSFRTNEGKIGQWTLDPQGLYSSVVQLDPSQLNLTTDKSRVLVGSNLNLFNETIDNIETGRIRPQLGRLWITDGTGTAGLEFTSGTLYQYFGVVTRLVVVGDPADTNNWSDYGRKYKIQYALVTNSNSGTTVTQPHSVTFYIHYLTVSGWKTKTVYFGIDAGETITALSNYSFTAVDLPDNAWTTVTESTGSDYIISDILTKKAAQSAGYAYTPTVQLYKDNTKFDDDNTNADNVFNFYNREDNNTAIYYSIKTTTPLISGSGSTLNYADDIIKIKEYQSTTTSGTVKLINKLVSAGDVVSSPTYTYIRENAHSGGTTTTKLYAAKETIGGEGDGQPLGAVYTHKLYVDEIYIRKVDETTGLVQVATGIDAFTNTNVQSFKGCALAKSTSTWTPPGSGGGGGCFEAGTKITMADGSLKNIEDIKKGDKVLSYNVYTNTLSEQEVDMPVELVEPLDNVQLIFSDGTVLNTTMTHPFWTTSGWVSLKPNYDYNDLYKELKDQFTEMMQVGQKFFKIKGHKHKLKKVKLLRIRYYHGRPADHKVYNLSISNYATFFANGILGHNAIVKLEFLQA